MSLYSFMYSHLSVCQEMEMEAHCEMKEIEEMLSLFGSDTPPTTLDAQDKRFNLLISVHVDQPIFVDL